MKKFLPIFLIIIFASMVAAKTTQAIGIEEILTSLSDKLYSLRNILTAQVSGGCITPISIGSRINDRMTTCYVDQDCKTYAFNDCGCMVITYNTQSETLIRPLINQYIACRPSDYCAIVCPSNQVAKCQSNRCVIVSNPGGPTPPGSTRYSCNTTTYQCAADNYGPYTSPTECQTACKAPAAGKPTITDAQRKCTTDANCRIVETDCCGCSYGGDYKTKMSINYTSLSAFSTLLKKYCTDNKLTSCTGASNCRLTPTAKCVSGLCTANWPVVTQPTLTDTMKKCTRDIDCSVVESSCCGCEKGGNEITKIGINKSYLTNFLSLVKTYCYQSNQDVCSSTTNNCKTTPTAACVKNVCLVKKTEKPTITDEMRKCTTVSDCNLVETDCCDCKYGGDDTSKKAINKNYLTYFDNSLQGFCGNTMCTALYNCKEEPKLACENNLCVTNNTQTPNPNPPAASTLWFTQDGMIQPGDLWYDSVKACKNGATAKSWETCLDEYLKTQNITAITIRIGEEPSGNVCLALGCELPTINIEVASAHKDKMKSLGFEETVNPGVAPTYQWYKANVTLGNPQELWYQAVVSCAPQNSTKEKWEQCFKDYFVIQKIGIKQLIVNTVPTGSCTPTGCQAPAIQVQVSQEFKAQMTALGFSEIDDPTKPVDPYITKIDLAKQGLLYGIDKTNNNIVYEIVDKTAVSACGDGVCAAIEKYLYEVDLMQNCSINDKEIINYKHCYSDCKGKMDTGKSVTKVEFNLLKPQCSNKPAVQEPEKQEEPKSFMPLPKKPIAQMTQDEKNEYIKELQVFLIELLTQMLNLLRIQKGL